MLSNEIKLALFLAYKSIIKSKVINLVLIILIITAAFTNVTFFISFFGGMVDRLDQNLRDYVTSDIKMEAKYSADFIEDVSNIKKKILSMEEVKGVSSSYLLRIKAGFRNKTMIYYVQSVSKEDELASIKLKDRLVSGQYLGEKDSDSVLLGKEITGKYDSTMPQYSLDADLGDTINIIFPNGVSKDYKVKGVVKTGNWDVDLNVFIPVEELEKVMGLEDKANTIVLKISDNSNVYKVKKDLINLGIDADIFFWWEKSGFSSVLSSSFELINIILLSISLMITAFSLIIIIYLNIIQKRKHIGLMKAIGIKKSIVMMSYIFQSIFYTMSGILISNMLFFLLIIPSFNLNPLDMAFGPVKLVPNTGFFVFTGILFIITAIFSSALPIHKMFKKSIIYLINGDRD
jgi:putative ABC transport system permease protein